VLDNTGLYRACRVIHVPVGSVFDDLWSCGVFVRAVDLVGHHPPLTLYALRFLPDQPFRTNPLRTASSR